MHIRVYSADLNKLRSFALSLHYVKVISPANPGQE